MCSPRDGDDRVSWGMLAALGGYWAGIGVVGLLWAGTVVGICVLLWYWTRKRKG